MAFIQFMKAIINKEQKQLTEADILKKLEKAGVDSSEEYELITRNLIDQNQRLKRDREQLKIRVDLLKEKQRTLIEEQKHNRKRNPTVDFQRLKRQLDRKYKEFEGWQKKCYNSMNRNALNVQVRDYVNQCVEIDSEIKEYKEKMLDQKRAFKHLQKAIKDEIKTMNRNVPQRQVLEQENRELRRRIWNLRIVEDLTGHVEVRAQNNMIGLQNKKRLVQRLKTMTVDQIKREQLQTKVSIINHEVRLKNQIDVQRKRSQRGSRERVKTESGLSRSKSKYSSNTHSRLSARQTQIKDKEQEIKQLQDQLEALNSRKQEVAQSLAAYSAKLAEQEVKQIPATPEEEEAKEVQDICLQVKMYEDEEPLRKQIVGREGHLVQDDRLTLKGAKEVQICGFMAYESQQGIAYVTALYSNGKQTPYAIPEVYLEKHCKGKKMVLSNAKDHLKWIKVYHAKEQNEILRIQIYSQNKIKFEAGKAKDAIPKSATAFKFDNNANEIPTCLIASYTARGEDWVLSSFGVEFTH